MNRIAIAVVLAGSLARPALACTCTSRATGVQVPVTCNATCEEADKAGCVLGSKCAGYKGGSSGDASADILNATSQAVQQDLQRGKVGRAVTDSIMGGAAAGLANGITNSLLGAGKKKNTADQDRARMQREREEAARLQAERERREAEEQERRAAAENKFQNDKKDLLSDWAEDLSHTTTPPDGARKPETGASRSNAIDFDWGTPTEPDRPPPPDAKEGDTALVDGVEVMLKKGPFGTLEWVPKPKAGAPYQESAERSRAIRQVQPKNQTQVGPETPQRIHEVTAGPVDSAGGQSVDGAPGVRQGTPDTAPPPNPGKR